MGEIKLSPSPTVKGSRLVKEEAQPTRMDKQNTQHSLFFVFFHKLGSWTSSSFFFKNGSQIFGMAWYESLIFVIGKLPGTFTNA